MIYDYIKQNYTPGQAILNNDLVHVFTDKNTLVRKQIQRLISAKKLFRVARGIYSLPQQSITGMPLLPGTEEVIEKKYIANQNKIFGYYSGLTFLNNLGISYQVPNTPEIVTNSTSWRKRNIKLFKQSFIVKLPRVKIDKSNVRVLQFLDILPLVDKYADVSKVNATDILIKFAKQNKITSKDIIKYSKYYPAIVSKKILELNLYGKFA